jgi:adenosylhomocysteine nucleosidase
MRGARIRFMKNPRLKFSILVSANAEWMAVKSVFPDARLERSPYGERFYHRIGEEEALFFHGGLGKVAAAGSTQYVIDHFHPANLINIGTCGGVEGRVQCFDVVVPDKLVIYDVYDAMGSDSIGPLAHYTTELALPADFPTPAVRTTLYSADRDLTPSTLREIENRYRPTAVDWESGAIAWVAKRNETPLLIIRAVSDLVSLHAGEAENNEALFVENTARIMPALLANLPKWMAAMESLHGFVGSAGTNSGTVH